MNSIKVTMGIESSDEDVQAVADICKTNALIPTITKNYGRKSMQPLPPIIIFTLGAIAGGFLGEAGKEIYLKLKKVIKAAYVRFRSSHKVEPNIQLHIPFPDTEELSIFVNIPMENEEIVALSLEVLPGEIKNKNLNGGIWFNPNLKEWGTYEDVERWRREGSL